MAMDESVGRAGEWVGQAMEPMSEAECWDALRAHGLGRLAVVVDGAPVIYPVNYRAGEGAIVFRTAPGEKLSHGPLRPAAFEIDGFHEPTLTGWSVVVKGVLREVTEAADARAEGYRRLPVAPAAPGQREHWLALYADSVTGRRFRGGQPRMPGT